MRAPPQKQTASTETKQIQQKGSAHLDGCACLLNELGQQLDAVLARLFQVLVTPNKDAVVDVVTPAAHDILIERHRRVCVVLLQDLGLDVGLALGWGLGVGQRLDQRGLGSDVTMDHGVKWGGQRGDCKGTVIRGM